jgi:nicotinate-nucleotide pyrophosphorylase (carboxylating)
MMAMIINALPDSELEPLVRAALAEDFGAGGDITSDGIVPAAAKSAAKLVARKEGILCGMACARLAFSCIDPAPVFYAMKKDGDPLKAGNIIATVEGPTRSLLKGERVALNFLTHLSGIASLTQRFVQQVSGTHAKIYDTRKTIPGLRQLQKYAVQAGGGHNHRMGLYDAVLIKDNHIAAVGSAGEAVRRARQNVGAGIKIEVEIDRLDQLEDALAAVPDIIMLDNFSLADMKQAVALIQRRTLLEASGGVDLSTVRSIAETGVDIISVGALTHSAPALDIGLDF